MKKMKCLICDSDSEYYFSKIYTEKPFDMLMKDIGEIRYYKCTHCGFTISKTHGEMVLERWQKLNFDFHELLENRNDNEMQINQPPYIEQATMLKVLSDNSIINMENPLDYAGGYGTLSNILSMYFNINLPIYEPYVHNEEQNKYILKKDLKKYSTVICSGLFEHLTTRQSFEEINNCVVNDGCLIIHTRISEEIPADPNWFYLNPPVHCAFHTNKSMQILMNQWGYVSSVYCLSARLWILIKKDNGNIKEIAKKINKEFQTNYLVYKNGFVDFWKGF
jgi:Methyltransferase domain